jgi:branched-chain amino acid transport system substrate-binding protein
MKKILKNQAGFYVIGIIITVVVVTVLAVFFMLQRKKEDPIKIGAIISLSGSASNLTDVRDGMILAADEINSRGGINRRKIELIIEDSKTNPQEGKEAFNRIEQTHHPLLYVSTLSYVSMALSPLAERNEVVLVGLVVGNPTLTKQKKWVFRYYSSAKTEIPPIIYILNELNVEKLGILYSNDEYGTSFLTLLKEAFEKMGGTVKSEPFDIKNFDFGKEIEILRGMEAIYAVGFPKHLKEIFRRLKKENYHGFILGPSAAATISVRELPEANGVYLSAPIIYKPNYLFAKVVKEKYEARYDKSFNHQAANGYDFVKILAGLLKDIER